MPVYGPRIIATGSARASLNMLSNHGPSSGRAPDAKGLNTASWGTWSPSEPRSETASQSEEYAVWRPGPPIRVSIPLRAWR